MARPVTLAVLLATVRKRSDTQNMLLRHPDADVINDINDSWQKLREKVSEAGSGLYLVPTTKAAMTAGLAANAPFGSIPIPSTAVRVYGVDVYVSSTDIRPLAPVSFADRCNYGDTFGQRTGVPQGFAVVNIGTESTTTVTGGTLALFPAPDKAYDYVIWHVPAWTPVTNTTYVFDGIGGWEEWVAWDVTVKIRGRDGDLQGGAQIAAAEREAVWRDVILPACRFQRAAPGKRTDTAANRRCNARSAWRRSY